MVITQIKTKDLESNTGQVQGLPSNPRQWTKADINKIAKSLQETPELFDARPVIVYPQGDKFVILGGNLRFEGAKQNKMKEVPAIIFPEDTPVEKLKEIVIKDNGSFGAWDYDMLGNEWDDLPLVDWGVPAWETEQKAEPVEVKEDDFDEAQDKVEERCVLGDIWKLGEHRLMCGDSTSVDDVEKLMQGEKASLVFTDPPYGMKKESEGVLNDNLNYDDLLAFNKEWIPLTFAFLQENGSWYCWGIDEPLMDIYSNILKPMKKENKISIQNYITWDKGTGFGQNSNEMRSYSVATEKCWFVILGVQGYNTNADNYWEGWESIRLMLNEERKKSGLTTKQINNLCGKTNMTQSAFTKGGFRLIVEDDWNKLKQYCAENGINAFKQEYEKVKQEYEKVKQEWYNTRAYFDNTHDNMNDVWHFARTSSKERSLCGGHATPKPLELCARAIKSSSRSEDVVLDVFGGSGSTMMACEQLGRKCRMMELDTHYCDVIIARWEKMTGQKAERL